ncbi:DUF938 domain-containing protein [uncultured Roseobacter sp.]|uniref:DUF938 domain-containing protein n=1 Tax=uncultured Roseobacter sp. TaxID=114847 RepID=UPI00260FE3E2|nr:DUF938 domain-containing protein [uncultured Roseobacter sp.]
MPKIPSNASVAQQADGAKLHAPAAARNADALVGLLAKFAPNTGAALEIASGTGQHVAAFAAALPELVWQPTEVDPARLASINAYAADAGVTNVRPALALDATQTGWHRRHSDNGLIVVINLLHLIDTPSAETVLSEALKALRPDGRLILYGPFRRNGQLTSEGDRRFDADLRAADPDIGYKNDGFIEDCLIAAGASTIERVEMPANNLAFIAKKG